MKCLTRTKKYDIIIENKVESVLTLAVIARSGQYFGCFRFAAKAFVVDEQECSSFFVPEAETGGTGSID